MKLLQEIPGYKRIIRTVIQMQIRQLVDYLGEQTGDECIILVASVQDKSLYQLGTKHGQEYLSVKDDLKTDFLGHCLKKFQKDQGDEGNASNSSKRTNIVEETKSKSKKRRCQYKRPSVTTTDRDFNYDVIDKHGYQSAEIFPNNSQSTESTTQEISANEDVMQTGHSEASNGNTQADNVHMLDSEIELIVEEEECLEDEDVEMVLPDRISNKTRNVFPAKSLGSSKDVQRKEVCSEISPDINTEDIGENDTRVSKMSSRMDLEDKSEEAADSASKPQTKRPTFLCGKALSEDLRTSIIFAIIENGGDVKTGSVPRGVYTKVQRMFKIPATSTVTRTWERYIQDGTVAPK